MKRAIALFFIAVSIGLADTGQYRSDVVVARNYGAKTYSTLTNVLAKAVAEKRTVLIDGGVWTLTNTVTVPTGVNIDVARGSRISGSLTNLATARPEWWGALTDDGVGDSDAINAASLAASNVLFSSGEYTADKTIRPRDGRVFSGAGINSTVIKTDSDISDLNMSYTDSIFGDNIGTALTIAYPIVGKEVNFFTIEDLTIDCNFDGIQTDSTNWVKQGAGAYFITGEGTLVQRVRVVGFGSAPHGGTDAFVSYLSVGTNLNATADVVVQGCIYEEPGSMATMVSGPLGHGGDLHLISAWGTCPIYTGITPDATYVYNGVTYDTSKSEFAGATSWGWTYLAQNPKAKTVVRDCLFRGIDVMSPSNATYTAVTFCDCVGADVIENNTVIASPGVSFYNKDTGAADPFIVRGNTLIGVTQGIEMQPDNYGGVFHNVVIENNYIEFAYQANGPSSFSPSGIRFRSSQNPCFTNVVLSNGVSVTVGKLFEDAGLHPILSNCVIRNNTVIYDASKISGNGWGIVMEDIGELGAGDFGGHTNVFKDVRIYDNTTLNCLVGQAYRYRAWDTTNTTATNLMYTVGEVEWGHHNFLPEALPAGHPGAGNVETVWGDMSKLLFPTHINTPMIEDKYPEPGRDGITPPANNWTWHGACEDPRTFQYGFLNMYGTVGTTGAAFTATFQTNHPLQGCGYFEMAFNDVTTNYVGVLGVTFGPDNRNIQTNLPEQVSVGGWVRAYATNMLFYALYTDYADFQSINYRRTTSEDLGRWIHIGTVATIPATSMTHGASCSAQIGVMQSGSDGYHSWKPFWEPGTKFDIDNLYIVPGSAKYGAASAPPAMVTTAIITNRAASRGELIFARTNATSDYAVSDPNVGALYVGDPLGTQRITYNPNANFKNLVDGWGGCGYVSTLIHSVDTSAVAIAASNTPYTAYDGRGCISITVTNVDATEHKAGYYSTIITSRVAYGEAGSSLNMRQGWYKMGGWFRTSSTIPYLYMRAVVDDLYDVDGYDFRYSFTLPGVSGQWVYKDFDMYLPFWTTNLTLRWGFDMRYCGTVTGAIDGLTNYVNDVGDVLLIDSLSFGKGRANGLPVPVFEMYEATNTVSDYNSFRDGEIIVSNSVIFMSFSNQWIRISN